MSAPFLGLDFGTTNSALAWADAAGEVALTRYEVAGRLYDTFRSVLYFDPDRRGRRGGPLATCGIEAIAAYLDSDGSGRFIQSVKSHLASRSFTSTAICGRSFNLEELVTEIILQLRAKATAELPPRVVVGRPVHFVHDDGDDPEIDAFAEDRLRRAVLASGFDEVRFELEPVAAAYRYESRLLADELVLIADFGGGTTDLCIVDVGPKARTRARAEGVRTIRSTDGVALAGDAFDRRIIEHAIAPRLGQGTRYRVLGGEADVPLWLYSSLAQWHRLSFLKSPKTLQLLADIAATAVGAEAGEMLGTLHRIVDEDLSYGLHQAVERAKITLTTEPTAELDFDGGTIRCTLTRSDFESWIAPELERIAAAIERVLERARLGAADIDRVFLTGGSSLVPAVRALFAARFGDDKLRGGEEMTSVGSGLALVARDVFGAADAR